VKNAGFCIKNHGNFLKSRGNLNNKVPSDDQFGPSEIDLKCEIVSHLPL
jgi:hypothetical protein